MVIAIGADHGGFEFKEKLKKDFSKICEFVDVGAEILNNSDDYTEFSFKVGECVARGEAEYGIMICRTGVGAVIALNKIKGIRAGVLESAEGIKLARKKNNINVLSFGADNVSYRKAKKIVEIFLSTEFEGGRHKKRLEDIQKYEARNFK